MMDARLKLGMTFGLPPLMFVLALVLGWNAATSPNDGKAEHALTGRISPRQQIERMSKRQDPGSRVAAWELMINRPEPAVQGITYDAKGAEMALRDDWTVHDHSRIYIWDYLEGWIDESPQEAFEWMSDQGHLGGSTVGVVMQVWASRDLDAALAAAYDIKNRKARAQALMTIACVLSEKDFDGSRRLLLQNLDLYGAIKNEVTVYSEGSSHHLLALFASLPDSEIRTTLVAKAMKAGPDSAESIAYWDNLSRAERIELVKAGFQTAGETYEGFQSLRREYVEALGGEPAYRYVDDHSREWVKDDFEGSIEWVNRHLKGSDRTSALGELWNEAAGQDLDGTIAKWKVLPDSHMKRKLAEYIANSAAYDERDKLLKRLLSE